VPSQKRKAIKLRSLEIHTFKAFDSLEIDFPSPRLKKHPDVFVMGSKNGLGKTSVLEACALLFLSAVVGQEGLTLDRHPDMPLNLSDLLIRAGANESEIKGDFVSNGEILKLALHIPKSGKIRIEGNTKPFKSLLKASRLHPIEVAERFIFSLVGLISEPLILPPLMYFHSYRKVKEGNPELGMMVEDEPRIRRRIYRRYGPIPEFSTSTFKLELLRSMMSRADLFENLSDYETEGILEKVNELVERYAGGTIYPNGIFDLLQIVQAGKFISFTRQSPKIIP